MCNEYITYATKRSVSYTCEFIPSPKGEGSQPEIKMKLVDEIREGLELQVRITGGDEYFEAVFQSEDLDKLSALVKNSLGEPLKPPGKNVRFPRYVQKLVDSIGGIRHEQSFYLKEEANGEYIYVALWPWQSDPSKITLKIGKGRF